MDTVVTTISQLVSNLGFPIACVYVMFWQLVCEICFT